MRKTATLLLLMVTLFILSFEPVGNSSSLKYTQAEVSTIIANNKLRLELDRRISVEKQMYDNLITKPSIKWLLTGFIDTQIFYESSGNQSAISPEGAQGIAQFMPDTWRKLIESHLLPPWFDITNEAHQRIAQLVYLDYLYTMWQDHSKDSKALTIASYNAGPGAIKLLVEKYGQSWKDSLPSATTDYLAHLNKYL